MCSPFHPRHPVITSGGWVLKKSVMFWGSGLPSYPFTKPGFSVTTWMPSLGDQKSPGRWTAGFPEEKTGPLEFRWENHLPKRIIKSVSMWIFGRCNTIGPTEHRTSWTPHTPNTPEVKALHPGVHRVHHRARLLDIAPTNQDRSSGKARKPCRCLTFLEWPKRGRTYDQGSVCKMC